MTKNIIILILAILTLGSVGYAIKVKREMSTIKLMHMQANYQIQKLENELAAKNKELELSLTSTTN